ncbi:TlpA family protein disulfide reductase [bacterium]|nr:TlpA family protein disulfide reductase [bacterium]
MKKNIRVVHILWLVVVLLIGLSSSPVQGKKKFLSEGMTLPQFTLSEPLGKAEQTYLGLKDRQPFELSQVPAKLVLIELFEVNCGICNEQAPLSNKLYNIIKHNEELSRDIKMIGIGAGNNVKQIGVYKKKKRVPFPLFTDQKFEIFRKVGRPGVPFHILVDQKGNVLLTELGLIEDVEEFFREIVKVYEQQ